MADVVNKQPNSTQSSGKNTFKKVWILVSFILLIATVTVIFVVSISLVRWNITLNNQGDLTQQDIWTAICERWWSPFKVVTEEGAETMGIGISGFGGFIIALLGVSVACAIVSIVFALTLRASAAKRIIKYVAEPKHEKEESGEEREPRSSRPAKPRRAHKRRAPAPAPAPTPAPAPEPSQPKPTGRVPTVVI